MGDRAVVSLHVGHYANHVGAHFWNIQEANFVYEGQSEICHDVLFREGQTLTRQLTFTPRVVNVDLKGALGSLPEFGDLYDDLEVPKSENLLWQGATVVQKEEPLKKNSYQLELDSVDNSIQSRSESEKDRCESGGSQDTSLIYNLDDQIHTWSDYLHGRFHPKSNALLQEYQHKNTLKPFDVFGLGVETWKSDLGEEVEDRIRFFVEDADSVQGFQLLLDDFNGFGGVGSGVIDLLSDEYGNKTALTFPTSPCAYDEYSGILGSTRLLNTLLNLNAQLEGSTLVTPLTLAKDTFVLPGGHRPVPWVQYKPNSMYHSSAILGSALDSMTLPWRMNERRARQTRIYDLANGLNGGGRKLGTANMQFPWILDDDHFLVDALNSDIDFVPLMPGVKNDKINIIAQSVTCRGFKINSLKPTDFNKVQKFASHPFHGCSSLEEALERHFGQRNPRSVNAVHSYDTGVPVSKPFPDFFDPRIGKDSRLVQGSNVAHRKLNSVPSLVTWSSSDGSHDYLESICDRAAKVNLNKLHRFRESGTEDADVEEAVEKVRAQRDNYTGQH
ncbi:protein misato homolog 1-like [Tigriopus californicus]|nr:protein misato homolog 1-like [Tigriopus californicus]